MCDCPEGPGAVVACAGRLSAEPRLRGGKECFGPGFDEAGAVSRRWKAVCGKRGSSGSLPETQKRERRGVGIRSSSSCERVQIRSAPNGKNRTCSVGSQTYRT